MATSGTFTKSGNEFKGSIITLSVQTKNVRIIVDRRGLAEASRYDAERLSLVLPRSDAPIAPMHWSFGQLASLAGVPAAYLR